MTLRFYLAGLPPSVNHYWRTAGHRRFISAAGQQFREDFGWQLKAATAPAPTPKFTGRVHVSIALRPAVLKCRPEDWRRFDPDNSLKVLLDCLTMYGVIVDDSAHYVRRLTIEVEDATDTARTTVTVEDAAGAAAGEVSP